MRNVNDYLVWCPSLKEETRFDAEGFRSYSARDAAESWAVENDSAFVGDVAELSVIVTEARTGAVEETFYVRREIAYYVTKQESRV